MAENARACRICEKRRPRRFCPGVGGDICPICCGTEREKTVNCPLSCPYLQEARKYEKLPDVDPRQFPNQDIKVDEGFLERNEPLLILIASSLARVALETTGAVDGDAKEALDSLVRTYRALQSGLVYEVRPENPIAGRIHSGVQQALHEMSVRLAGHDQTIRDADALGILAFLQRVEIQHNNGRPKGRAFIDFLTGFFPPGPASSQQQNTPGGGLILTP
jgi:hypothetical protein